MRAVVLCLLLGCALGMSRPQSDWTAEWENWKQVNEKLYIEEEEDRRRMVWEQNFHYVIKHNYEYDQGKHTYKTGMNKFADLTNDEFKALYLGEQRSSATDICKMETNFTGNSNLPTVVDWRKKGYVTPVKNQLQCGSCWAFSTTGSLEGQHFKKTGKLVSLSEQNLVDCSTAEGDMGCSGGLMDNAFLYIRDNGGIDTEASYPYHAKKGACMFNKRNVGATLTGCVDLPMEDEMALKTAVAKVGPISVAIDAGHRSFQLYESGVYYEPMCSQTKLDHGVLAVGYGTEGSKDYWLVKNSWGESWGREGGYVMMSRNRDNNCGIASKASYPIV